MRNLILSALLLASVFQSAFAQGLLQEQFGSGANAFTMEFVTIGNPGNVADTTGGSYPIIYRSPNPFGSVANAYNLGKYEVSRDMIDKANSAGSLDITMSDMTSYGGNGMNRPATGITWYEAAKFVNYLNTSKGSTAAYKFDSSGNFQLWSSTDAGYNANNLFRNSLAKFFLPSTDEWYKGAYGSPGGTWYDFPNSSDIPPTGVVGGTDANTSVYVGQSGPSDVNNAGGLNAWGTMAQGGNVWEWMETAFDGINNAAVENLELRGGAWNSFSVQLDASFRTSPPNASWEGFIGGFRVASTASIPEPSSLSLLSLGAVVVALNRKRVK